MQIRKFLIAIALAAFATPASAAGNGAISFHGGMMAGGKLFRVVSTSNVSYLTPDGRSFDGTEFSSELDEFGAFGIRFRKPWKRQWSFSGGLSFSDMGVTANRRTISQNVDTIEYDQALLFGADLSAELDWIQSGSTPYISLGLGYLSLDFEERSGGESVDQQLLTLIVGGGYRFRRDGFYDFDFGGRAFIVSPDFAEEEARLPQVESFESTSPLWIWELTAAWVYEF
jgi:hypothetical protein